MAGRYYGKMKKGADGMPSYSVTRVNWPKAEKAPGTGTTAVMPLGPQERHSRHMEEGRAAVLAENFARCSRNGMATRTSLGIGEEIAGKAPVRVAGASGEPAQ